MNSINTTENCSFISYGGSLVAENRNGKEILAYCTKPIHQIFLKPIYASEKIQNKRTRNE